MRQSVFQRGTYATDKPVEIKGKGHLTVSGAGGGTRIVAKRSEAAFRFEDCASVTLHDLDIAAPDGTGAIGPIALRLGRSRCLVAPKWTSATSTCAAAAAPRRSGTCLTIRGSAERALQSVRWRNRLAVGLTQDGMLIACVNTLIADNEIEVVPARPAFRLHGGSRTRCGAGE